MSGTAAVERKHNTQARYTTRHDVFVERLEAQQEHDYHQCEVAEADLM